MRSTRRVRSTAIALALLAFSMALSGSAPLWKVAPAPAHPPSAVTPFDLSRTLNATQDLVTCVVKTSCTAGPMKYASYSTILIFATVKSTATPTVSDSASNTITLRAHVTAATPSMGVWIYDIDHTPSASSGDTFTISISPAATMALMVREVVNTGQTPYDTASTGVSGTGNTLTQTLTTSYADEFMYISGYSNNTQAVCSNDGTTFMAGNWGYIGADVEQEEFAATGSHSMSIHYGTFSPPSTCTPSSTTYAGIAIAIKSSPVNASYTFSPAHPDAGESVTFTNSVSGGTPPYVYAWSFGDGGTSTSASPSHTFAAAGNYVVYDNVTANSGTGAKFSYHKTVHVHAALADSFTFTPTEPAPGDTVTFTSSVSGGWTAYTYAWDFGDTGTSTAANPTHVYAGVGTYTVQLTVTDAYGHTAVYSDTVDVVAALTGSFSWSPTSPEVGLTVTFTSSVSGGVGPYTYAWAFGDGGTSTATNPTHVFTYGSAFEVYMNVTDSHSTAISVSNTVTVASRIAVTFSWSPTVPDAFSMVAFTSSVTGGVASFTYSWDFGDGGTSTSANPTHAYDHAASFTVQLAVTDSNGVVAYENLTVTVNADPSVSFTASPNPADVGTSVAFNSSVTGGTSPFTYAWDFGNGDHSTSANPVYSYPSAGTYTVDLNVTDADSVSATDSVTVTIHGDPTVMFLVEPTPTNAYATDVGYLTPFNATVSAGTPSFSYSWTLGDSGTATGKQPTHTYATSGTVTVSVTATDAVGKQATFSHSLLVYPSPSGTFGWTPGTATATVNVKFHPAVSGGQPFPTAYWFVNGTNVTPLSGFDLNYTFASPGNYTVAMDYTDLFEWLNVTRTVRVYPLPSLPAAPTLLAVASTTSSTVGLAWTNPGGNLTNVSVTVFSGGGCTASLTQHSAGLVVSYTVHGLAGSTNYSFEVFAWNAAGHSGPSNCANATTLAGGGGGGGIPAAPSFASMWFFFPIAAVLVLALYLKGQGGEGIKFRG